MKNYKLLTLSGALALLLMLAVTNIQPIMAQNQILLEDFFKNPEKSGYQISPDGRTILIWRLTKTV